MHADHTESSGAVVATVLQPEEQSRVETAAGLYFRAVHAASVTDARRVIREGGACAVLVSTHRVGDRDMTEVEQLVRDFPGVPAIAVLSRMDALSPARLLSLGASGVRQLIDLSRREGFNRLREIVVEASPIRKRILARLLPELREMPSPTRRLFEEMVWLAPVTPTVRRLTARLQLPPSTFMSRFFRAGLPSPKRYLAALRLLHAAALMEIPGLSISDVAYRLDYSSPQSFGRHVRSGFGLTAGEFRSRYPFDRALENFVARLIVPYRARLRSFRPT